MANKNGTDKKDENERVIYKSKEGKLLVEVVKNEYMELDKKDLLPKVNYRLSDENQRFSYVLVNNLPILAGNNREPLKDQNHYFFIHSDLNQQVLNADFIWTKAKSPYEYAFIRRSAQVSNNGFDPEPPIPLTEETSEKTTFIRKDKPELKEKETSSSGKKAPSVIDQPETKDLEEREVKKIFLNGNTSSKNEKKENLVQGESSSTDDSQRSETNFFSEELFLGKNYSFSAESTPSNRSSRVYPNRRKFKSFSTVGQDNSQTDQTHNNLPPFSLQKSVEATTWDNSPLLKDLTKTIKKKDPEQEKIQNMHNLFNSETTSYKNFNGCRFLCFKEFGFQIRVNENNVPVLVEGNKYIHVDDEENGEPEFNLVDSERNLIPGRIDPNVSLHVDIDGAIWT